MSRERAKGAGKGSDEQGKGPQEQGKGQRSRRMAKVARESSVKQGKGQRSREGPQE
jgi:hypothetical protein